MGEWIENMDWALFVAVLSLLFTGLVSLITIRYTRKSLRQNEKSNKLSEESLIEARKNYREQRERLEEEVRNTKERNIVGMNIINGIFIDEVEVFIRKYLQIINNDADGAIVSFNYEKRNEQYFFEFKDKDNKVVDATNFWFIKADIFYSYIFEAARIDGKCLHDLRSIYNIYIEIERLFHVFVYLLEEERFRKYSEIKSLKFNFGIEQMLNDLLKIKDSLNLKELSEYNKV
ncbi:hypothetical protein [Providencia sp. PROV032]|uniref:hypothetical protein n=1 Tax=Providencia sp. PROV032 TaxID=2949764 RepID=UPI00234B1D2F|nr:hypothetical protein [Providencia sp. PROV032]